MRPFWENILKIVVTAIAICVIIVVMALVYSWIFGAPSQPQYINAPVNYGTVTPAPIPTPAPLPQVLQMTVARVTYLNGHFEVDGMDGKVAYFPDLNTCQTIREGSTYLFTPTGMYGNVYLISDSVTILRNTPYRQYTNNWQTNRIYSDQNGYWENVNGVWTNVNYGDIPSGVQIYSSN